MSLMNSARLGVGAQSVGIAEAAYREAVKYAHERAQFGTPIIQFPAVYEMITNMKVLIDAHRSLLYETARFVDLVKALEEARNEGRLEKEERKLIKQYGRLADVFTPMIKLMGSEMSNKVAYDSLQIHGGTGFMKDFPIERIYRDARITSIYEGTSQLQVVAAIRGVTTGVYAEQIKVYDEQVNEKYKDLQVKLQKMTEQYLQAVEKVEATDNTDYLDFHARRLVEMAGNIIMGYLLIMDSQRDEKYEKSAKLFIDIAAAKNQEKNDYINNFDINELVFYQQAIEGK